MFRVSIKAGDSHNFTRCDSAESLTAYAGLAPSPYQSGTSVHGRACIGHTGNARLRTVLYLATLSAAQHNPVIAAFYERLVDERMILFGQMVKSPDPSCISERARHLRVPPSLHVPASTVLLAIRGT